MSADLSPQARCFAIYIDDRPVAFAGVLPLPVSAGKFKGTAIDRVTRVVVLPDWQGCGLVFRILETLGSAYSTLGRRFRTYPAHRPFIRAFERKSSIWDQKNTASKAIVPPSTSEGIGSAGGRPCAVFEYVGPTMDRKLAERLLALG